MPGSREPASDAVAKREPSLDDLRTLRRLVRHLRQGIFIEGRDGQILDANPALAEMLAVGSVAELRGQRLSEVRTADGERDIGESASDAASPGDCELRVRRTDGEVRTLLVTRELETPSVGGPVVGVVVDVTEHKRLEVRLRQLSVRDPLTGCYNRRYLAELESALGENADWGTIFIDIEDFGDLNAAYGHTAGDTALVRTSRFLLQQVRADDVVLRIGGDEFLILVLAEHAPRTAAIARRLVAVAKRSAPYPFGCGWARRRGPESLEETIARADGHRTLVRVRADAVSTPSTFGSTD